MTTPEVLTVRTAPEAWTVPRADEAIAAQLSGIGRLGVAFSGGVDSSLLLALAARALGPEQVVEGGAPGDTGDAGVEIEIEQAGDAGGVDDPTAGVLRGIAVGATEAPRHDATRGRVGGGLGQLAGRLRADDVGRARCGAAPSPQQLAPGFVVHDT